MTEKEVQTEREWNDGELADYPAEHQPDTHVTAGIQESFGLNPHITDNEEEMKDGRADPYNRRMK